MTKDNALEVWMRGPIQHISPLLQPVAHALLQVEEDVSKYVRGLDERLLWLKPNGRASVAFHIQHIVGVTDRMFTYAKGHTLSDEQFAYLSLEGKESEDILLANLLEGLQKQINKALSDLGKTDSAILTETRYLGRKRIPTTTIGLLFHAAEHAQRHVGQLLVTVDWVKSVAVK